MYSCARRAHGSRQRGNSFKLQLHTTREAINLWPWLFEPKDESLLGRNYMIASRRRTILAELGRCHKHAMPLIARRLCELKPPVAEWSAWFVVGVGDLRSRSDPARPNSR
jgi:hypothetical protein